MRLAEIETNEIMPAAFANITREAEQGGLQIQRPEKPRLIWVDGGSPWGLLGRLADFPRLLSKLAGPHLV